LLIDDVKLLSLDRHNIPKGKRLLERLGRPPEGRQGLGAPPLGRRLP